MKDNRLIIAAAGAGKTTYLVNHALDIIDSDSKAKVLITTYTISNTEQIREKFKIESKKRYGHSFIPDNITIISWFALLLKDGVRPFKSIMHPGLKYKQISLLPDFNYKEKILYRETDILNHYFIKYLIILKHLSKFIIKANEKTNNSVFNRLEALYTHIFIDEVQDLAGYDLEIIKKMFESSSSVLLVGDPRQVTFLTHHEKLNSRYKNGKIRDFIVEKCDKLSIIIDEETLKYSHRNNQLLCDFSSTLYPNFEKSCSCSCSECKGETDHIGVFLVRKTDIESYINKYGNCNLGVLRRVKSIFPDRNFGDSKGLTYDRVIIHPPDTFINYLKNGDLEKKEKGKLVPAFDIPKFYVAITRARYSVAIIYDYKDSENFINGVQKYI